MQETSSSEPIGQFFSQAWRVYEKVVASDYLGHLALYRGLAEFLTSWPGPVRMLELGCGDARHGFELLRARPVESYLGIDSSSFAVELGRQRLAGHDGAWRLVEGDIRSALDSAGNDWNIALSSFCLHHLSADDKRALLGQIRAALRPPGAFLLVDVFREVGESREAYLTQRHAWLRKTWTDLTSAEHDIVAEHECAADFPETVEDYTRWALEAGFESVSLDLTSGVSKWITMRC